MANPTSNFNWQMPTPTDLVTDLPADFEVFGQAVDTTLADLKGGTTGQVLSKNSNTDMDFVWVTSDDANAIQNAIVDAKGDLIAATANDTPARLAAGTTGQILSVDPTEATGLKWITPNPGDITAVTAGTGISGGGTSGDVTITNSMATAIDAKGDLIGGTGADTFARLAVGANDTVLTADSSTATGLKWAAPAGGGGGMTLLSTTAITATTAINVTSIDQTYTSLVIYVENFKMGTNQTNIFFRFNNNSGTIYSTTASNPNNSAILYQTGATSMFVGGYANLANTGNNTLVIQIPFYSTTASYKTVDFNLMSDYGTGGTINVGGFVGMATTSAITEFNLFAGNNLSAQGNIKIYGVK